jgi:2-polyprenyl-6-methoxyphenol hydroxylase-like FAD-dependent oxidoreductase
LATEDATQRSTLPGSDTADVVVVGANMGGLAAGIALKKVGLNPIVLERMPSQPHVNGGLHVWTNGSKALAWLGIEDELRAGGAPVDTLVFADWRGKTLLKADVKSLERTYGHGAFFIPRADLPRALLRALGDGTVRFGSNVTAVRDDGDGVTATLSDGTEVRGKVLIGADGIGSLVRRHLFGTIEPRSAGYEDWGAVVDLEHPKAPPGYYPTYWGPGTRLGIANIGHGRLYWAAALQRSPEERDRGEAPLIADMLEQFRGWPQPIQEVIAATPQDAFYGAHIKDLKPMSEWGKGRITLMGDAAHATTPNAGRGASEALEDAVVVSRLLAELPDLDDRARVEAALKAYEDQRRKPTASVTKLSRQIGLLGKWKNPVARTVRGVYLRAITPPTVMSMKKDFKKAL